MALMAASGALQPIPVLAQGLPDPWQWPVGPPGGPVEVVRGFDPPDQPWLPGHRGVDLASTAGTEVRAPADGTVTFAGPVAGRGVIVIDHGSLRTTYEPVGSTVDAGAAVTAGEPIGSLAAHGSHCAPAACLHWGAVRGEDYLDPLSLFGAQVRLLPLGDRAVDGGPPPPPERTGLGWPVADPLVTSPFGMRVHPVTGVLKLHDGTDFRAPCGAPVRASAPGRVEAAGPAGAYGLQVSVDHGAVRGSRLSTSYSHLSSSAVTAGQTVARGQVVGRSGTTGSSTGCHLHFMVMAAGQVSDPMRWLPTGRSGAAKASSRLGRASAGLRPGMGLPVGRPQPVD